jgi:hypothetical protein
MTSQPETSSRQSPEAQPGVGPSAWSANPAVFPWRFDRGSRAREITERYFLPIAIIVSITVHVLIALQSTLFGTGGAAGGGPGDLSGSSASSSVVAAETTLESFTVAELSAGDPTDLASLPSIEAPAVDLSSLSGGSGLSIDLPSADPGSLPGLAGSGLGGGSGDGDGFGEGAGELGGGGGGGGGARFFGVEARGSRFAYVVDVSGSMQGESLASLKRELTNSLDGLLSASSFLVLLFNSDSVPLGGRVKWIDASEPAKRRIFEMLGKVVAGGGTHPEDAFEMAFSLKPRPDAIYFMTDGLFDTAVAEKVSRWNKQDNRIVPIHCIAFGTRDSEALMRQIAQSSGGSFTYIAGP